MNDSHALSLDIPCSRCKIRPSDVGSTADAIYCGVCENDDGVNLDKHPYLKYGKYPFKMDKIKIKDTERFHYLEDVLEFGNDLLMESKSPQPTPQDEIRKKRKEQRKHFKEKR